MANIETITVGSTTFDVATIPADMAYSTTEKVVGTWIDGKPVYQRVAVTNNYKPSTSWTSVGSLSANIKRIIRYDFITNNTNLTEAYGENADGDKWELFIKFDCPNRVIYMCSDTTWNSAIYDVFVIYQYTKTTD